MGPEAESAYLMTSLTISDKRNACRKKSVSSWKEKNVTLKEKDLHANKRQTIFQLFYY